MLAKKSLYTMAPVCLAPSLLTRTETGRSRSGSTSAVNIFTAKVTDATGDVSAASAAWIEGTSGNNSFSFNNEIALAPTTIFGNGGVDTILMTAAVTLIDVDFAHVHGVQHLQLTGASSVTFGTNAVSAGINTLITGSGATSITDSAGTSLAVNAVALANNTALTLSGSAAEVVTGLKGDISASGLTGTLAVTAAQNTTDHNITIATGSAATSITDSFSTDTVTVNAIGTGQQYCADLGRARRQK